VCGSFDKRLRHKGTTIAARRQKTVFGVGQYYALKRRDREGVVVAASQISSEWLLSAQLKIEYLSPMESRILLGAGPFSYPLPLARAFRALLANSGVHFPLGKRAR